MHDDCGRGGPAVKGFAVANECQWDHHQVKPRHQRGIVQGVDELDLAKPKGPRRRKVGRAPVDDDELRVRQQPLQNKQRARK
jgi:hypothetical protein